MYVNQSACDFGKFHHAQALTRLESVEEYTKSTTTLPLIKNGSRNVVTVVAAFGMVLLGTGGSLYHVTNQQAVSTLPFVHDRHRREVQEEEVAPVGMTKLLSSIKFYLSLRVNDLAKVLKVERATIYGWQGNEYQPKQSNMDRISKIEDIARFWKELNPNPLGVGLHLKIDENESIYDLLNAEEILVDKVHRAMEQVSERIGAEKKPTTASLSKTESAIRLEPFLARS